MVQDGGADIHAGLFYSQKRDGLLDFSTPFLNPEYQIFVHYTVWNVNSLRDLSGFRIGVPKGFTQEFIETQLPDNALAVYEDFPALYEGAMRDEIRVFVSPQFNYSYYFNHHGKGEYQRFFPAFSAYSRDYPGAVSEGNQKLLTEINQGMAKINPHFRNEPLFVMGSNTIHKSSSSGRIYFLNRTAVIKFMAVKRPFFLVA